MPQPRTQHMASLNVDAIHVESFDEDEFLFARVAIGWARTSGTMFEGRLLEAHVGRVLRAEFPPVAISPWDLRVDGSIYVQVKAVFDGAEVKLKSDDPTRDQDIDVWIVVVKPLAESTEARRHLKYFVLSRHQVIDEIKAKSIKLTKLARTYQSCGQDELLDRVRAAAVKSY